jgi:hypothetical protein
MIGRKLLGILAIVPLFFGCGKAPVASAAPASAPKSARAPLIHSALMDSVLRIHWLGKKRIATNANAETLRQIWALPETLKLETQTLDKLSSAPWRLFLGQTNQAKSNLLRPLLDDVIAEECCLEIRKSTNSPAAPDEIVFAIHLDKNRAELWQTNMAAVLKSLTGIEPQSRSATRWFLQKHDPPNAIDFAQTGDWVVIGIAQNHNQLFDESLARIEQQHTAVVGAMTNGWLEGNVDLARFAAWLELGTNNTLPKASFSISGEESNVVTKAELDFTGIELSKLEPWNIPTNLVGADFVAFTAIRGLKPVLQSSEKWTRLQAGPPPDQLYIWALRSFPMQTYFAAPLPDASNAVSRIRDWVIERNIPAVLKNPWASFEKSKTFNGISWRGFPFFSPFLQSVTTNRDSFVFGGFFVPDPAAGLCPPELSEAILSNPNLVYYDWDLTGPRVEQLIQLGQGIRLVTGAPQLPGDSVSFAWLKALIPRIDVCGTRILQTGPARMSFSRKSTLGLSATELHLLADWLESPEFPRGLYSSSPQPAEH